MQAVRWTGVLVAGALAASSPASADPPYETTVVGPRVVRERPADDPAAFTTEVRLEDVPAGSELALLLAEVPGLRLRDSGGAGGRKGVSLRGTDSQQTAVYLDGFRLSSPGGGAVDLSLLDPGHLERIQIRRGGGSARFGAAALGGALLLHTPRLRLRQRSRASLSFGSWNTLGARVAHGGSYRGLRFLASGAYRRGDGDFTALDDNRRPRTRINNDFQLGEGLLKADLMAAGRWRLGLLERVAAGERGAPGVLQSQCERARQLDVRNLVGLSATRFETLTEGGKLELRVHHRLGLFRFQQPCAFNQPSDTLDQTVGGEARLELPLRPWLRLDGGVELAGHLMEDRLGNLGQQPRRFDADLWAGGVLRLLARRLVLVPTVRVSATTAHGFAAAPRLGLVARPLGAGDIPWLAPLALVLNGGRSYRYPSFQELYITLDGLQGNPELAPEDAWEVDAGLRWSRPRLELELAYYRRWIDNLILFAPVSAWLTRAGNYRDARVQGVEGAAAARLGAGLGLSLAYTFTDTGFGADLELPGHPRHRLVARLDWRHVVRGAGPPWSLHLWTGAVVESPLYLDRFNTDNDSFRTRWGGTLRAGGAVAHRGITLTAEARNIDSRRTRDALGFPRPPASFFVALSVASR